MAQASDSTIATNLGSGGPALDADTVTQSDGATQAVRERVTVGFETDNPRGRLASASSPLPVGDREAIGLLREIREELRDMKVLLHEIVNE